MYIIGHRGNSATAPENTMSAFTEAWRLGAQGIELDVVLTRDNKVVVFHDTVLDRTTNAKGPLALQDWSDLKILDAGSWFAQKFASERIPLLSEVFEEFGEKFQRILVELKGPRLQKKVLIDEVISLVKLHSLQNRVHLLVTSLSDIELIHSIKEPSITIQFFTGAYLHPIPLMFRVEFNTQPKLKFVGADLYFKNATALTRIQAFSLDYLVSDKLVRDLVNQRIEIYLGARQKVSRKRAEKLKKLGLTGIMRNDVTPLLDLQL